MLRLVQFLWVVMLWFRFAASANSGGGKLNIVNLEPTHESGNGYFCFVEATGFFANLAIEVQMGMEMQIGGSTIVEAWSIARSAFVVHNSVE
jgi:hypothetical protein